MGGGCADRLTERKAADRYGFWRLIRAIGLLLACLLPGAQQAVAQGAVAQGAAEPVAVELLGPEGITLKARLFLPSGGARGVAVVALHGCGGAFGARDRQWREVLNAAGHAVLFPDSFGSRGLGSQCRVRERVAHSGGLRRQDAIAAARWLAARPESAPGGVVLLGWSDGGSTTVATAGVADDVPAGLFRGFIAFYPGCAAGRAETWRPSAPMMILHGEADAWTPIAPCRRMAERVGVPLLTLHAYPDAVHDFDAPVPLRTIDNIPAAGGAVRSVQTGENPAARADVLVRVPAWIKALPPVR